MRIVPRRHLEESQLDMTPMIDVTFLLLIFFMCTLKFKTLEGRLDAYLPPDVGPSSDPAETPEALDLVIEVVHPGTRLSPRGELWIPDSGRYVFGSDRVLAYTLGPARFETFEQLQERLEWSAQRGDTTRLVLDPREGVVQSEVITVLDHLAASGWSKVTFHGAR